MLLYAPKYSDYIIHTFTTHMYVYYQDTYICIVSQRGTNPFLMHAYSTLKRVWSSEQGGLVSIEVTRQDFLANEPLK